MGRYWSVLRRLVLVVLATAGMVAIVLAATYGALQTDTGRRAAVPLIERGLAALGMDVRIEGLTELSAGRLRLAKLSLLEDGTSWFSADNIDLTWRSSALLQGRVDIASLSVSKISVSRRPPSSDSSWQTTLEDLRLPVNVSLDKLAVGRLSLGPTVLGMPATFGIEGRAAVRDDGTGSLRLDVRRQDAGGGQLAAHADYALDSRKLDLSLSLVEPADGLLVSLLDVPGHPAVSASLTGTGSLDGWHGRFEGAAGDALSAQARIDLAFNGRLSAVLSGQAEVAQALPAAMRGLAAGPLTYDLKALWDPTTDRVHLEEVHVASDTVWVAATGTLNGGTLATDARLTVAVPDARVLEPLIGPATARSVSATITVGGAIPRLSGHVDANLAGLSVRGLAAERLAVAADYTLSGDGPVATRGSARLAGMTGLPGAAAALVGGEARADWTGNIHPNGEIDIASSRIRVKAGTMTVSGTVAAKGGKADLAGSFDLPDLTALGNLVALPMRGEAAATAMLHLADGQVRGTVTADVRHLALPTLGGVADGLGPEITLAADVAGGADTGWRVDNIVVDGGTVAASGQVALPSDLRRVDGSYRIQVADLAAFGVPASGPLTLTGTAGGPMTSPTIKGRVVSPTLRAAGETWRDLAVDYDFGGIPARSQGTVDARVRSPWDNVVLKARLAGTKDGRLAIDGLELATLKSRLTGAVSLDTGTGLMQGKLALSTPDLAPWSAVLGMPTGGAVSGTLILRPAKGGQDAVLDIEGHRLRIVPTGAAPIAVDRATAKISIASLLATPRVDGAVGLVGFARQDQRLATVEAHLKGGRDRLAFDLTAAGAKGTPVDITTAGWLALGDGTTDLAVTKLSGAAYGQQIALAAPARFHRGPDGLAADDFTLQVGQGIVVGNARLSNRTITLDATVRRFPLSAIDLFVPGHRASGTVDGEMRLRGTAAAPEGRFRITTNEAKFTVEGEPLAIRAWAEGTLTAGDLALKASIDGPGKASASLDGRLPVHLSVDPLVVGLKSNGGLDATLRGEGDLAALLGPFIPDPHRIGGKLDVQLTVSGTAGQAAGFVRIAGGRYENIVTGMVVHDITMEGRVHDTSLDITRADGQAGNGRVSVSGSIGLVSASGLVVDLAVKVDKANIVGRDDATAVASGGIAVKGALTALAVRGKVTIDEAEVRLVDRMPPDVVNLKVVEINGKRPEPAKPQAKSGGSAIALDLAVTVPNRLFVRGRGLDSEWSGTLRIAGTTASPRVSGQLSPVRGQFSFAGKTFALKPSSTVAFRDPESLIPALDITAEYSGTDFTASFTVRGPADDPKLVLSSVPVLPQDEIVSRLLFGRGVARISVVEAAQLADTLATLSGRGGFSILDSARRLLGVDVLRVDAGSNNSGPSVTAGRYLGKDVYVGVSQGTGAKSGEAKVEVEVTPHITIETEVGPTSGGQLGARWKYDY